MSPDSLKQMVACGLIDKIIINAYPSYFTIIFLHQTPSVSQHLTLDDRKGLSKRFRSAKSLYSKIAEILNWPVNPEAFHTLDPLFISINFCCYVSPDRSSNKNDKQLVLPL